MPFLDGNMLIINKAWAQYAGTVNDLYAAFNTATEFLLATLPLGKVGRKFTNDKWETRFNRALFEVQVYYFSQLSNVQLEALDKAIVVSAFQDLCNADGDFQESIETSTKTIQNYETRFTKFQTVMNAALGLNVDDIPVQV